MELHLSGHIVSIAGVNMDEIEISTDLEYETGYSWDMVKRKYEEIIDSYLHELNQNWANQDKLVVRISQIETRLLNMEGILDIKNTMINGQSVNYILDRNSIVSRKGEQ